MLNEFQKKSDRQTLGGVPEGYDALVLARLTRASAHAAIHIARDDARLAQLAEGIGFFAPDIELLAFPAWDCLPYDRVSPNATIVSRRLATLARLATVPPTGPCLVVTTVNAVLQRVPARDFFRGTVRRLAPGSQTSLADLVRFFGDNGYTRTDTVREPGEFAVRGGIIDVFPPGAEEPLRLDFFGDEIEAIRRFDPLSQRSLGTRDAVDFAPVSEVALDAATVQRFRTGYREMFGAETASDPLYEAVSAGRRHIGMEHWLPLYHERLETLLDYVAGAVVTLDHQAEQGALVRQDLIREYYDTRKSLSRLDDREGGSVYKPMAPDRLYLMGEAWAEGLAGRSVLSLTPFVADGPGAIDLGGRLGPDFAEARNRPGVNVFDQVRTAIAAERAAGRRVVIAATSEGTRDRLGGVLRDHGIADIVPAASWADASARPEPAIAAIVLALDRGFTADGLTVISEQDILGERMARPGRRRRRGEEFLTEMSALAEGDLVVHVEHGIGRYEGLETLNVTGAPHDCLRVLYAGNDKLFVPVENIEVLSRYGPEESDAQLDKLGGAAWQARKAKVKERIRDIAEGLIRIAAERQVRVGEAVTPPEGLYDEFCARFPYPETEDQQRAIEETLGDLASGRPTDRLICGDVGFGKTEVALRAAFVAAMAGTQVAVVVPTTLLCRQHFRTFTERFHGLPLRIAQLSRLVTAKDAAQTKRDIAEGRVEIVIGTHALLSKSIAFSHLGLLVVDEEQHFGVAQKERLKALKTDVHVLTLTATPIPRTLQMALSGVREMSVIATPPVDRLAVRTFVLPYDGVVIREAILREHYRGGQTFYICPRIEDLTRVGDRLKRLVPEVKLAVAHGRMAASELESVMTKFCDGAFDVLLSTQIVESGLDIPSVNTLVLHRADMFGLAQLYQLRGRVGRSKVRAYAYLTLPPDKKLGAAAQRRLEVMQTLDTLGAGFTVASHDLDIRGAGNLLGEEQSGHIREVGIELYQAMLEEAVADARNSGARSDKPRADDMWTPAINLGASVLIPDSYVADLTVRLGLYRRIALLVDRAEIDSFAAELIDRFGALPAEVDNLLQVVALKRLCRDAGVEKVEAGPKGVVLSFRHNRFARPDKLVGYINKQAGSVTLRPDHKLVFKRAWHDPQVRLAGINKLMQELAQVAA
ncbi:MAG: transcription-repair coupling factor [Alphaproteobacteria bacterium]|nr:transcription-repair coupling factor [Alphaproteobacteria bacterium]